MKTFLVTFLIFTYSIIYASDTTSTKIVKKDTITVNVNESKHNILVEALPYLVAFVGIISTLLTVFITNNNQRKMAQAQIDANIKSKWINDIIDVASELQTLFENSFIFSVKKFGVNIPFDFPREKIDDVVLKIEHCVFKLDMLLSPTKENEKAIAETMGSISTMLLKYIDMVSDKKKTKEIIELTQIINKNIHKLSEDLKLLIEEKRKELSNLL